MYLVTENKKYNLVTYKIYKLGTQGQASNGIFDNFLEHCAEKFATYTYKLLFENYSYM